MLFRKREKAEDILARRERMLSDVAGRISSAKIEGTSAQTESVPRNDDIKYSLDINAFYRAEEAITKQKEEHKSTFQEELLFRIFMSEMSSVAFYKRAHIDRKLFSAIKRNKDYSPQKPTAVACCLALRLDLDQTKVLLEKAGYGLSEVKQWDQIIRHCIECGYYDIDDVNFILDHFGEKPIGY